ncbi:MAG TPA: sensor histidine kinase, partial [Streptomyces sp.]|nr:sensor histidine kinase [Streptomyces sp.]
GYLVLCLALALRERRSTLIAVWAVTLVLSLALGFLAQDRSDGTNVLLIVLSGIVLLLGAAVRERGDAQRRLAEQETISEAERARRTLLEERTRIARELHDVVAHHMSVITVQADSAPYRLTGLTPEAQEEFGSIAATARESLSEMRRLLGVLRSEENHGERAPQPGLDRLGQLVEATVRAGVPAELSVARGLSGLPQAVQLSAYRIVQEALANVVRHAPGAPARVSVTGAEGGKASRSGKGTGGEQTQEGAAGAGLTVLIVNGPPPGPAGPPLETTGTGHGLVGMRERVRLVGGTLDVGPLPDGGFRVAARLPLFPAPLSGKDPSPS